MVLDALGTRHPTLSGYSPFQAPQGICRVYKVLMIIYVWVRKDPLNLFYWLYLSWIGSSYQEQKTCPDIKSKVTCWISGCCKKWKSWGLSTKEYFSEKSYELCNIFYTLRCSASLKICKPYTVMISCFTSNFKICRLYFF